MTRPLSTHAARSLVAHVEQLRAVWEAVDLDDANTFFRVEVRAALRLYADVLDALSASLPDVEAEASGDPLAADDASDPSLPFAWAGAA